VFFRKCKSEAPKEDLGINWLMDASANKFQVARNKKQHKFDMITDSIRHYACFGHTRLQVVPRQSNYHLQIKPGAPCVVPPKQQLLLVVVVVVVVVVVGNAGKCMIYLYHM